MSFRHKLFRSIGRRLFDSYANRFDHHLQQNLDYHVPEQMVAAVSALWDGKPLDVLDLGCGTGLCGPLVRPMARTLSGVDLSPAMIEMAKKRGIYDHLEIGNLIDSMKLSTGKHDLLLCTDVLICRSGRLRYSSLRCGSCGPDDACILGWLASRYRDLNSSRTRATRILAPVHRTARGNLRPGRDPFFRKRHCKELKICTW